MLSPGFVLFLSAAYLGLLFAVARFGDARADAGTPRGAVFVAFAYYEAAINRLTNAALDPFAKIPEFKYCAIRVKVGGEPPHQSSYGGGQILAAMAH